MSAQGLLAIGSGETSFERIKLENPDGYMAHESYIGGALSGTSGPTAPRLLARIGDQRQRFPAPAPDVLKTWPVRRPSRGAVIRQSSSKFATPVPIPCAIELDLYVAVLGPW